MWDLLSHAINAEIASVKESRSARTKHVTVVVLNVGSDEGVKAGMELYVHAPSSIFEFARITSVSNSSSEAEIIQDDEIEPKATRPAGGWKLSTRLLQD